MTNVPYPARVLGFSGLIAAAALAVLLDPAPATAQNLAGDFDDWIVMADGAMSLALTTDDNNRALGIVCGPDCFVYVEDEKPCVEGHIYSARLEAGGDNYSTPMECKPSESGPLLVMPLEDRLLRLIDKEETLGIAIERDEGPPGLVHFPLAGSGPAIDLALAMRPYLLPADTKEPAQVEAFDPPLPLQ